MDFSQGLEALLHNGAQLLQIPTMLCLVALILIVLWCLVSLLVEVFCERRHFRVNHRAVMLRLRAAGYDEYERAVRESGLLKPQVEAMLRVVRNMGLPDEELFALSQVELERLDRGNQRRVNLADTLSKVAPMMGLMGTLIPLGPGIVAMGQGDLQTLSSSIGIAFNTTIAGLVVAVVAVVVSRIRRTWYGQYATMMSALMTCVLEEAAQARDAGQQLPCEDWRAVLDAEGPKGAVAGTSKTDHREGGAGDARA